MLHLTSCTKYNNTDEVHPCIIVCFKKCPFYLPYSILLYGCVIFSSYHFLSFTHWMELRVLVFLAIIAKNTDYASKHICGDMYFQFYWVGIQA